MKEYMIQFRYINSSNIMQERVFGYNENIAIANLKARFGQVVIMSYKLA